MDVESALCLFLQSPPEAFQSPCRRVDETSLVSISSVCSRRNHLRWQSHKGTEQFLGQPFLLVVFQSAPPISL